MISVSPGALLAFAMFAMLLGVWVEDKWLALIGSGAVTVAMANGLTQLAMQWLA
jgi:hypothetical protein